MQHMQYMLLFLVLVVNSDHFVVTRSYSSTRSYVLLVIYSVTERTERISSNTTHC